MPIFKSDAGLIFFCHIPKCAGSSVELLLEEHCGKPAFLDRRHYAKDAPKWSQTSPQHIDGRSFERLFPDPAFFAFRFAFVREPVSRFVSAFRFHKLTMKTIDPDMSINAFALSLHSAIKPGRYDNHFLPFVDLIPYSEQVEIYRIEDQQKQFLRRLEMVVDIAPESLEMPVTNVGASAEIGNAIVDRSMAGSARDMLIAPVRAVRRRQRQQQVDMLKKDVLEGDALAAVRDFYRADYARAGYGY